MKIKIIILLLLLSFSGWGQTIVFSENMGSPSGNTSISSNTFQNTAPLVFSGDAEVRITGASSVGDYAAASGNGNIFFTSTTDSFFEISGINTLSYSGLTLSFGHYKNLIAASNELIVEVSSDGVTYNTLTYSRATGSGTANWILISPTGTIPSTANLRIRFHQLSATAAHFRIDDVVLKGTPICSSSSTWDGSAWSSGVPTASTAAIINGNYDTSLSGSIDACSLIVNSPAAVSVADGQFIKLEYNLTVDLGASVSFENNSSLVQVNPIAINSGSITYKRTTTTPVDKFDYTYWSTPVYNQQLIAVSPTTAGDKFYSFDPAADDWSGELNSNIMIAGKGYIIRGPQANYAPNPINPYTATFVGEPISGTVSIGIGGTGISNLIGNPYPSALDAAAFLSANSGVLDGTIYFWTHNTDIGTAVSNPGSGTYAYSSDDYASYNATGGTQATSGTVAPNGVIGSGQSFFTTSVAPGTAVFTNAMRLSGSTVLSNSMFFKLASGLKEASESSQNRLWLNLTNEEGAFKQTLVGYVTGASNEFENAYDGVSFNANAFVNLYSVQGDLELAIQGRALPFDDNDIVPLGYSVSTNGEFKIEIAKKDGLFVDGAVYLEDKLLNIIHDLKKESYRFSTVKGVFKDRFVLRYTAKALSTIDVADDSNLVLVATKDKRMSIKSTGSNIDKVYVYDFLGKLVYRQLEISASEFKITNLNTSKGTLIVKVVLQDSTVINRKISY